MLHEITPLFRPNVHNQTSKMHIYPGRSALNHSTVAKVIGSGNSFDSKK